MNGVPQRARPSGACGASFCDVAGTGRRAHFSAEHGEDMRLILPALAALALTTVAAITLWRGESASSVTEADTRQRPSDELTRPPRHEAPASLKASLKAS
jgi:hypothetical protein